MINENSLKFNTPNGKRIEQKAEAFLNLADEVPLVEEVATPTVEQQPHSIPSEVQPQAQPQPQTPTDQERIKSSLNMGPTYLAALEEVNRKADIRSFETELPILRESATVGPLTGKEEQGLKTLSASIEKFMVELNRILFLHTKFESKSYNTFEDFLGELFPPDKTMLTWALLVSSYLNLPDMDKPCPKCKQNFLVEASPKDLIHQDSLPKVWDKASPPDAYTELQTTLNGYLTFEIGLPSEKVRLLLTSILSSDGARENVQSTGKMFSVMDSILYFTRSITVGEGNDRIVLTDLTQDIMPFLRNLSPKIADAVRHDIDITIFDEYMPNFYLETTCTHCGYKSNTALDPEMAFFRKTILV